MTDQATPPPPPQMGGPVPPPPGGPIPPPAFGEPAPEAKAPSKFGGIVKRLIGAVVVFAVLGLGGLAWRTFTGEPSTASVGDCMTGQSEDELKIVECTDATSEWKVAGKVDGKTEAEARDVDTVCGPYETSTIGFWEGKKGGKGFVLCLEPVQK